MTKRGALDLSIGTIITIAIIGFVLFLVFFGLGSFGSKVFTFFDFLPDFNRTAAKVDNIEILRYDIIKGEVNYYDGTNWNSFSEVSLRDKTAKYENAKRDFEKFYYESKRESGTIEIVQAISLINVLDLVNAQNSNAVKIDKNLQDFSKFLGSLKLKSYTFYVPAGILTGYRKDLDFFLASPGTSGCKECQSGEFSFQIMNKDLSRGSPIYFVLGLGNEFSVLYTEKTRINSKGELLTDIFNKMRNWRDSIFAKPISFNYKTNGADITNHFCTKITDNRYMVIDLSKGVDANAKC